MAVKITSAGEQITVDAPVFTVIGLPGAGKTSLLFTASKPLNLAFDKGVYRAMNRGDSVLIDKVADIEALTEKDLEPYDTVGIDTAGMCLDVFAASIASLPKMSTSLGQLTQAGYGALGAQFVTWLKRIKSYGKTVVILCHAREKKMGEDAYKLVPQVAGNISENELYTNSDAIGVLRLRGDKRVLDFSPQELAVGKNPCAWPVEEVPNFLRVPDYLAQKVEAFKVHVSRLSTEGKAIKLAVDTWRERIASAGTAEALTALVAELSSGNGSAATIQAKALVVRRSKEIGVEWNREAKAFAEPVHA